MTVRRSALAAALVVLATATCIAAFGLPLPRPAVAQSSQALDVGDVDVTDFPEVTVTVTAPAALVGQELPDDAFTVTEAGAERDATFEQLPSDDLEVVLLVDTSGSMGTAPMAAARQAAIGFTEAMPAGVRLAVIEFNTEPDVLTGFTTARGTVTEALEGLVAEGFTALYDAVLAGLGLFDDDGDTRRAMVLLSDGGDTISDAGLEQTRQALADSDAVLYVVELQTAESEPDALVTLARATGGRVVSTGDPAELAGLYEEVASKLVNNYRITYESATVGRTQLRIDLRTDEVTAFSSQLVTFPIPSPGRPDTEASTGPETFVGQILSVGWIADPWVPYAGAGLMFAALAAILLVLLAPRQRPIRLDAPGSRGEGATDAGTLTAVTQRLVALAERRLERRGQSSTVALQLERAGINLRPGEFIVLATGGAAVLAALGFVVLNVVGGIVGGVLGIVAARTLLSYLSERRRAAFGEQLPDTLQLMSGSLRTGYGVMQALDAVVREADEPTASEFRRLLMENRLGRDLSESLAAMAERIGLEDFEWVVQAINIHRDVGGDLAEVLDRVGDTIRERDQIRRQIKALSAEGRLSAVILVALPIFMVFAISILQPGYLSELTTEPIGWVMIVMGTTLMVVGTLWVKRLVRLVF